MAKAAYPKVNWNLSALLTSGQIVYERGEHVLFSEHFLTWHLNRDSGILHILVLVNVHTCIHALDLRPAFHHAEKRGKHAT